MNSALLRGIAASMVILVGNAWANCGSCGSGSGKDKHAEGQEHHHTHAEIGEPAPNFTLKDLDGKPHSLADLKGKVVVLEWINHECPISNRYCNNGTMKNTVAKFKDKPVVWLAIDSSHFSSEKADSIRKWVEKNKINYTLLLDSPGQVGHAYVAKTTPHMFVIDQKGVLAYQGAVDNDPYGNQEKKRNYVDEAVTALLNGSTVAKTSTKPFGCSVKYKK
jgi:peroxiredoxin